MSFDVLSFTSIIIFMHHYPLTRGSDLDCSGNANDLSVIIMASSICALIFDYTSEETLLNHPNFDNSSLHNLYKIIARSLASCKQVKFDV